MSSCEQAWRTVQRTSEPSVDATTRSSLAEVDVSVVSNHSCTVERTSEAAHAHVGQGGADEDEGREGQLARGGDGVQPDAAGLAHPQRPQRPPQRRRQAANVRARLRMRRRPSHDCSPFVNCACMQDLLALIQV